RALEFIPLAPNRTSPAPATTTRPRRRTDTAGAAGPPASRRPGAARAARAGPVGRALARLTPPPRHRRPRRHDGPGRGYAPDDSSRESRALLFRPEKPSGT